MEIWSNFFRAEAIRRPTARISHIDKKSARFDNRSQTNGQCVTQRIERDDLVSRRRLLQAGMGLGVAAAVPASQHLWWNGKSFERAGYDPDYLEAPPGEESWANWSGIAKSTPQEIAIPESEEELSDLVRATSNRVRPVGSGHSFTSLVPTEGTIVDLSGLDGLRSLDPLTGQATFGAGTRLFQAAAELAAAGRALPNLPDIDVQTLAGTFSTATHGTGAELTALHDYIAGFRLVTATGDVRDVTRESDPDLFAAGKVSLGALGVITQYTLETQAAFNLRRVARIDPIVDVIDQIDALADGHRNFEFFYTPGTGYAAVLTHDFHNDEISGRGASGDDDLLLALQDLRDTFGWWPWLRRRVAQSAFPTGVIEDVSDASHNLLSTTRPIKFNEMEYHLPRENGVRALQKVIEKFDRRKDAFFPVEVRFVAPDDAWLSPFRDGPDISIAIHAAVDEPYDYFFSEFEPLFLENGGRPHWGKLHSLDKATLSGLYPNFDRFCELREDLDPSGKFLNSHLATLFGEEIDD